jgi:SAM-dependent methyltransferase
MQWLILAGIVAILCFGFVLLFGPPYLPTLNKQARLAIEMINLKPGETLLELGCGDGKLLKLAAATGVHAIGYELNPILVVIARLRTWRHRKYVKVVWGNFWDTGQWPEADGIFVFVLQRHMKKLDHKIAEWHKRPVKLVSFAFPIPGKKTIDQDKSGVYLYEYN